MESSQNILSVALNHPVMQGEMELVYQKTQMIPGTVQYVIKRFRKYPQMAFDDTGMLVYNYKSQENKEPNLELVFCISGNRYCKQKNEECNFCKYSGSHNCEQLVETVDVATFRFNSDHLSQFLNGIKTTTFSEDILHFRHTSSFTKTLPLCGRTRTVLDALLNHSYSESLENIFINAQTQMLLLYSMECMAGDSEDSFTCKFLANEADREKIALAREILLQHISEPLTIREFSRKAAINECYLKKGLRKCMVLPYLIFFKASAWSMQNTCCMKRN